MMKSILFKIIVATKIVIATSIFSPAHAISTYMVGNSLTWDTKPNDLEGSVDYHIGCSKNLQQIYDDPSGSTCVDPKVDTWDVALNNNTFDYVTVQPHKGTTLVQDSNIINAWMQLQPTATFIIHTGWSTYEDFESNYHASNNDNQMKHSAAYFADLTDQLTEDNPGREIISTQAIDVLDSIYHDIETGDAPFSSFDELYRDAIHMNDDGRYLAHNLMRQSLGQEFYDPIGISSSTKTYLDAQISAVAVPFEFTPALGLLTVGGIFSISRLRKLNQTS